MRLFNKTQKQNKNNGNITLFRLLAPMIVCCLVCTFCLISMTWAWFTASVATPMQTIQGANRSTTVEITEITQPDVGNPDAAKIQIKSGKSAAYLAEDSDENFIISGGTVVWELSPEKSYEVAITGSGTASSGYCDVTMTYAESGSKKAQTLRYTTDVFEKGETIEFVFNTGGFSEAEGVTQTQFFDYIENTTTPTLSITTYWGKPEQEDSEEEASLLSSKNKKSVKRMKLSDGDVFGFEPIPCPEAKGQIMVRLNGFKSPPSGEISAEEDYELPFKLKKGYEMPEEIIVVVDGDTYVVSAHGEKNGDDEPYYNVGKDMLVVPVELLSDGCKVSVVGSAIFIPEEEPQESESTTTDKTADATESENNTADGASTDNTEKDADSGNAADNKTEDSKDTADSDKNTESEAEKATSDGDKSEATSTESKPDSTVSDKDNSDSSDSDGDGKKPQKTDTVITNTTKPSAGDKTTSEPSAGDKTTSEPSAGDKTTSEQSVEKSETKGNDKGLTENKKEESTSKTENDTDSKTTTSSESTISKEPSKPTVTPEASKTESSSTTKPADSSKKEASVSSPAGSSNSGSESKESNTSNKMLANEH